MFVGRAIGWLLVLAALVFVGLEALDYAESGRWAALDMGSAVVDWGWFSPADISQLQAGVQRHLVPWLWSHLIQPALLQPVWAWAAVIGVLFLILFRVRN